ncbi:tetratricopeptide repeat protein [Vicingaceae bacterium]|nr:tetratricopeptide repeat protein [Vicingaceae bacterium]
MNKYYLIILLSFCFISNSNKAATNVDSLISYSDIAETDSLKANTLNKIANFYKAEESRKAIKYGLESIELTKDNSNLIELKLSAYNIIGLAHKAVFEFDIAKDYLQKGLDESIEIKSIKFEGQFSSNLGNIYYDEGDFDYATKLYFQSLKADESLKDTLGVIVSYITIGAVYGVTEKNEKSIEYFKKALNLCEIIGREDYSQYCQNNIGSIYIVQEKYYEALDYFKKSLIIAEKYESPSDIAWSSNNIGVCYFKLRDLPNSLKATKRALDIRKDLSDKRAYATSLGNYADIFFELGDFQKANTYYHHALEIAEEIGATELKKEIYQLLSDKNEIRKDYKTALKYHKLFSDMKDSLISQSSEDKIAELETEYNTEKKQQEIDLLNTEKELRNVEIDKKNLQQNILIIGLIIALLLIGYVVYNLSQKKKTNALLNDQNKIIEEKNRDITDSINYAERIQKATLPEDGLLKKHFESFIYFKPKDIVSGDFYWVKEIGDKIYFSAVDCTGHGVPGAFMSIIGYNSLNRIVEDFGISDTGEILDKLNDLVVDAIGGKSKTDEMDIRDGMDLSICCIDKATNTLTYSGAHNSLYLLRKSDTVIKNKEVSLEGEGIKFYEYKADKMAIGGDMNKTNYKTHSIQIQKEDTLYLFTDGFADQFGGVKGKKFMYKKFKQLILSIQDKSMDNQLAFIDKTLTDWKGDIDQLDDVCVLGVKIS